MEYTLKNGSVTAVFSDVGAELISLVCGGRERIWQNPDGAWAGHAPILFPYCGHLKNGPKHGFLRRRRFEFLRGTPASLTFVTSSDEETKKVYPYDFQLRVIYRLSEDALTVTLRAKNTGEEDMFCSCGWHPAFALSAPLGSYRLLFEKEERFLSRLHDGEGFLTGASSDMGRGKELILPEEFLKEDRTVILGGIKSQEVTLMGPSGPELGLCFGGFSDLLLWRPKESAMVCIEPWRNLPDGAGDLPRPFSSRKDFKRVPAGGGSAFRLSLKLY